VNTFLWNILLALIWVAITEEFTGPNLVIGFVLGYLILGFAQATVATQSPYFRKVWQLVSFLVYFLQEMLLANLRVAYDVVTPTYYMRPAVVAIPLEAKTDVEITLLSMFITLTPGTLSLDVSTDRKVLYIHAMFAADPEALRREIKEGFERRLLELLR
jgi:multicomponent Na+:H+ antiporter subunit E